MTYISKHDSEEEGESNHGKNCWVNFFVHWDTISINDFLENVRELISLDISRRRDLVVLKSLEVSSGILGQNVSNFVFFVIRAPEVTDIGRLALSHIVEGMIQSFFFSHKPFVNF